MTETGSSLRANKLRIVEELLTSNPVLVANREAWKDEWKQAKMRQIGVLMRAALDAENRVGLKLNVAKKNLERIIARAALDHRADDFVSLPIADV